MSEVLDCWLNSLRTASTRKNYEWYFGRFLDWAGMSAGEVLLERRRDLDGFKQTGRVRWENRVREYMRLLDEQYEGRGKSVRDCTYAAIRSFFSFYDVGLQMRPQDAPKGDCEREVRPVTKSEIRRLLAVSDPHDRALLLFMKDTGLAVADVAKLKIKDFEMELKVENVPVPVTGIRMKTRTRFHTFVGSETVEALQVSFEMRRKGTQWKDYWGRGVEPETINSESPVFRCKRVHKPMDRAYLSQQVYYLVRKAGLHGISAHSFRRFFETTLEQPDLNIKAAWIKRMMGHKLDRNEKAYSHPSEVELRRAYERAMPLLSVERRVGEERLRGVEEELEQSKAETDKLREELNLLKAALKRFLDVHE